MTELTLHATRRYSDMLPQDTAGNLFMYHLDQLIKDGYVEKLDKTYQLSTKGRHYAGIISVDSGRPRVQPKIVVMLVCQNNASQYLLLRWKRQPFMNKISLPYGKTHYGASVLDMAKRELAMKASMTGEFAHLGDLYVKAMVKDEVLSHMLAHVFEVTNYSGEPRSTVEIAECFWGNPADYQPSEFAPGFLAILEYINNSPRPFFGEITVQTE